MDTNKSRNMTLSFKQKRLVSNFFDQVSMTYSDYL